MENASSAEMSAASSTTKKMKKRFIKLFSSSHKTAPVLLASNSQEDSITTNEEASPKQSHKMQGTTELSGSESDSGSGSDSGSDSGSSSSCSHTSSTASSAQTGSGSRDESDDDSDDEESSDEVSDEEHGNKDPSWVSWFLSLPGNHLYLRVAEEFIEDEFNLTELPSKVPNYRQALDMIMDLEPEEAPETELSSREIKCSAKVLYSLIHARYLLTRQGMCQMADRYEKGYFGTCPRYLCLRTRVIPAGLSDLPSQARVQVYCPSCNDAYQLPSVFHRVDGAAFGMSFPHVFFKTFSSLVEPEKLPPFKIFEPRIFGFKLCRRRRSAQEPLRKPTSPAAEDTDTSSALSQASPQSITAPQVSEGGESGASIDGSRSSSQRSSQRSSRHRHPVRNSEGMAWLRLKPNYNRTKASDLL